MRPSNLTGNTPISLKRLVLATLAGGVTMWLLGGLWHTVLMVAFYSAATHAAHEGVGTILLAYLILAGMTAYLFSRVHRGGRPAVTGLKLGVLIGLIWVFPHGLAMVGAHGDSLVYVFKNAAWHIVEQGIGGVVIALVACAKRAPSTVSQTR